MAGYCSLLLCYVRSSSLQLLSKKPSRSQFVSIVSSKKFSWRMLVTAGMSNTYSLKLSTSNIELKIFLASVPHSLNSSPQGCDVNLVAKTTFFVCWLYKPTHHIVLQCSKRTTGGYYWSLWFRWCMKANIGDS